MSALLTKVFDWLSSYFGTINTSEPSRELSLGVLMTLRSKLSERILQYKVENSAEKLSTFNLAVGFIIAFFVISALLLCKLVNFHRKLLISFQMNKRRDEKELNEASCTPNRRDINDDKIDNKQNITEFNRIRILGIIVIKMLFIFLNFFVNLIKSILWNILEGLCEAFSIFK